MCRGFQQNERDHHRLLNIKSFYIRLSTTNSISPNPFTNLPHSLTLCYLPRINGSPLEINGSKIRPHSPAFVTLHRLLSPPTAIAAAAANNNNNNNKKGTGGSVYFGSRERVKASQGARFEVYLREHKVLKGIFRKDWDDRWKMECSCGLDDDDGVLQLQEVVKEAEVVCVAAEGHDVAMREKVGMVVKRKTSCCFKGTILEEIPEETECELDDDCCCCCSSDDDEEEEMGGPSSHFHKEEEEEEEEEEDTADMIEMEGVSWAVDVGIWVMCLGVGFLVSSNTFFLRRRKTRRTPFL